MSVKLMEEVVMERESLGRNV